MVVNPEPDIEVRELGEVDVLVVDNILSQPEAMRDFGIKSYKKYKSKTCPEDYLFRETPKTYELHPRPQLFQEHFPGFFAHIAGLIDVHIGTRVRQYCEVDPGATSLVLRKGPYFHGVHRSPIFLPHVDDGHVSSFLYLNPAPQCWGGTAIYRHLPTGKIASYQVGSDLEWMCRQPLTRNLTTSTDEWKLETLVEMRFNRFVAFNSSTIHKIYWPDDKSPYKPHIAKARLTLNNFFKYSR
jgi:hypothetical protein